MDRQPITQEGYDNLQEELRNLIKIARPKVIEDIAEARAHGDLKENAEYTRQRKNKDGLKPKFSN